jgi:hypothetical protein
VTANKNLLAEHGDEVFTLAAAKNLPIGFEASVASSIPIVRVIHESAAADQLFAVHGIMNGTANYILTQMESRGIEFDKALREAQEEGYAEAHPSLDIDGVDSRDKLCILARMAFGGKAEHFTDSHLWYPPDSSGRCPRCEPSRQHYSPHRFSREYRIRDRGIGAPVDDQSPVPFGQSVRRE